MILTTIQLACAYGIGTSLSQLQHKQGAQQRIVAEIRHHLTEAARYCEPLSKPSVSEEVAISELLKVSTRYKLKDVLLVADKLDVDSMQPGANPSRWATQWCLLSLVPLLTESSLGIFPLKIVRRRLYMVRAPLSAPSYAIYYPSWSPRLRKLPRRNLTPYKKQIID